MARLPLPDVRTFRQVLGVCGDLSLGLPSNFAPLRMSKVLTIVERKFQDIEALPPPQFDPEETYRAIVKEFKATGSLRGLPARQRRQAPWVYFVPFKGKRVLAGDEEYVKALVDLLSHFQRPRDTVSLLHRFLLYYPREWATWAALRKGLLKLLKSPSRRLQGWRDRDEQYSLLDARGAGAFADGLLLADKPITETLRDAHLTGELDRGHFVLEAYTGMLARVQSDLARPKPERGFLRKVVEYSQMPDGLRFDTHRAPLANALLEPFQKGDPPEDLRSEIERFMVRNYRHPGINPGGWLGVSEAAREVMLRWLVGTTLEDFFHVLDQTASAASAEGNRWRYRKAFWSAYHREGYIRDAWVAVGSNAKNVLWKRRGTSLMRYGELEGGTPNDCLLLLRIGSLTIGEWSHTGMCRFWSQLNKSAPAFYRDTYYKQHIYDSAPDEAYRHDSSASYGWQSRFADYIRGNTRAWVPLNGYLLR